MKNRFLLLTLSLCLSIMSYGQDDDLTDFKTLQVGIHLGTSVMNGDVFPTSPKIGAGIYAQKSFNQFFALRSTLSYNRLEGMDFWDVATSQLINRTILDLGYSNFVGNYATNLYDVSIEPLFTLNYSKTDFYFGVGPNFHIYDVRYDALDANGDLYDFSPLFEAIAQRRDLSKADRVIVRSIIDGEYETNQPTDAFFESKNAFGLSLRTGMNYSINSKLKVGVDIRLLNSLRDNLDGFRNIDNDLVRRDQVLSFSFLGNYVIGN